MWQNVNAHYFCKKLEVYLDKFSNKPKIKFDWPKKISWKGGGVTVVQFKGYYNFFLIIMIFESRNMIFKQN